MSLWGAMTAVAADDIGRLGADGRCQYLDWRLSIARGRDAPDGSTGRRTALLNGLYLPSLRLMVLILIAEAPSQYLYAILSMRPGRQAFAIRRQERRRGVAGSRLKDWV